MLVLTGAMQSHDGEGSDHATPELTAAHTPNKPLLSATAKSTVRAGLALLQLAWSKRALAAQLRHRPAL